VKYRWFVFSIISVAGLIADQLTKLYIDRSMHVYQSIPVVDNFFSITYVRNRGAAFSFLSHVSWRRPFFVAVSVIAAVVILVAFSRLRHDQRAARISLAMIFAGAVGNLIDRARMGEVIDFIDVYWNTHHWPAFNVADSLICVGVALLALDMLREEKRATRHSGRAG
jgi:signal peptidase II